VLGAGRGRDATRLPRTAAAGRLEPPWPAPVRSQENARGWVLRERLFQLHGAEGQQPSLAALCCSAATVLVVNRLVVSTLHQSWHKPIAVSPEAGWSGANCATCSADPTFETVISWPPERGHDVGECATKRWAFARHR